MSWIRLTLYNGYPISINMDNIVSVQRWKDEETVYDNPIVSGSHLHSESQKDYYVRESPERIWELQEEALSRGSV